MLEDVTKVNTPHTWLQSRIGQTLVVSDRIYLYDKRTWLEPDFPVIVIDAVLPDPHLAIAAAAREFANSHRHPEPVAGAAAGGIVHTPTPTRAELLYPDGTVRWTWVVVGVEGFKDSLMEI